MHAKGGSNFQMKVSIINGILFEAKGMKSIIPSHTARRYRFICVIKHLFFALCPTLNRSLNCNYQMVVPQNCTFIALKVDSSKKKEAIKRARRPVNESSADKPKTARQVHTSSEEEGGDRATGNPG